MVRYYLDLSDLAKLPCYYHPDDLAKAAAAKHGGAAGLLNAKVLAESMAEAAVLASRNGGLPSNEGALDITRNLVSPGIEIRNSTPGAILEGLKSTQDVMTGDLVLCGENEDDLPVSSFQTLRFDVGDRVSCLISSMNRWCSGKVVLQTVWRPGRGPFMASGGQHEGEYRMPTRFPPYTVFLDDGRTIYVAVDSNQVIRKELSLVELTKALNVEFAQTSHFGIATTKTLVYRAYAALVRLSRSAQDLGGGVIGIRSEAAARVLVPKCMGTGIVDQQFGHTTHCGKKIYWGQIGDARDGPVLATPGDTTLLLWEKDFQYKAGDKTFEIEIPHPAFNDTQTVTDTFSVRLAIPVAREKLFQRFLLLQNDAGLYYDSEEKEGANESTFFPRLHERINTLAATASVFPKLVKSEEEKERLLQELSGLLQKKGVSVKPGNIRVHSFTSLFTAFTQGALLRAFENDYLGSTLGCGMCPVYDVAIKPISGTMKTHHPDCEFMLEFGDPFCG